MAAIEKYLSEEGYKKLEEARKLSEEESKNDPETEPYKSKYQAREILKHLSEKIGDLAGIEDVQAGAVPDEVNLLMASIDYQLGVNYIDTEELHTGETEIKKCLERLRGWELRSDVCNLYQNALNQLGILWTGRRKPEMALKYLQESETLYKKYKHDVGNSPMKMSELVQVKKEEGETETLDRERERNFESTYTHTLYYLAQVFAKLDEIKKGAEYIHITLQRQLETGQYDALDWALNAATLSQYYMTNDDFNFSRHCLGSAMCIFQETWATVSEIESEEKREKVENAKADIARCWAKYGLVLLETSKERLMNEVGDMDSQLQETHLNEDQRQQSTGAPQDDQNQDSPQSDDSNDITKSKMRFDLELTKYEEQVTDQYVLDFSQARAVFLKIQEWLSEAKEFYNLDGRCSDHIEIIQDHSRAFKLLAFFEPDFERQCKMHKRRIDMLSAILKELNPQFYLLVCRQLMYEIAETYSTMIDTKLAIMESDEGVPTAHAVKKVNTLITSCIDQYQKYLDSLRGANKQFPEKLGSDDVRPALIAKFCIGRLFSKYFENNPSIKLTYMKQSLDHYKFLVDYCDKHPETTGIVKSEFDICVEMVSLLPFKMEKIRAQIS